MSILLILLLNLAVGACIGLTGIAGFLLPMFYTGSSWEMPAGRVPGAELFPRFLSPESWGQ